MSFFVHTVSVNQAWWESVVRQLIPRSFLVSPHWAEQSRTGRSTYLLTRPASSELNLTSNTPSGLACHCPQLSTGLGNVLCRAGGRCGAWPKGRGEVSGLELWKQPLRGDDGVERRSVCKALHRIKAFALLRLYLRSSPYPSAPKSRRVEQSHVIDLAQDADVEKLPKELGNTPLPFNLSAQG